jgi:hypothetical protein
MMAASIWGKPVSDEQTRDAARKRGKPGRTALISAAVAAWLIYDMASASEAPREAVKLLQYFLLAGAVFALAASLINLLSQKMR